MGISITARRRIFFLVIAGVAFVVTEFGRFVYRPWVYSHGIDDCGLADSIGNLGGIVVQIMVVLAFAGTTRQRSFVWSIVIACGYVAYEFLQPVLPRGTFDWKDVFATGIGWALAFPVVAFVWYLLPDRATSSSAAEENGENP